MRLYYRIYCLVSNQWEYIWLDENDPAPTTCPVNALHTINPDSISALESDAIDGSSTSAVSITEEGDISNVSTISIGSSTYVESDAGLCNIIGPSPDNGLLIKIGGDASTIPLKVTNHDDSKPAIIVDGPSGYVAMGSSSTPTNQLTVTGSASVTGTVAANAITVASSALVTNLNAQYLNGKTAPSSSIVGTSDAQTITNKTITNSQVDATRISSSGNLMTISGTATAGQALVATSATAASWSSSPFSGFGATGYYYVDNTMYMVTSSYYDQQVTDITNIAAGTYQIGWYLVGFLSRTDKVIRTTLKLNDSDIIDSTDRSVSDTSSNIIINGFAHIIVPTGSSSVQCYVRRIDGSVTITITTARLYLMRVS